MFEEWIKNTYGPNDHRSGEICVACASIAKKWSKDRLKMETPKTYHNYSKPIARIEGRTPETVPG